MAKKRKLTTPKAAETTTSTQKKKVQKTLEEDVKKPQELQQEQQEQEQEQENQSTEVEVEEEEEEEFEEEEVDEEEQEEEEEEEEADDEPISKLLEPFTKDQLVMILREAAESHPDVASRIRKVADEDTVHRKIFVHGLGWDSTADSLRTAFSQYGEIEDCKTVTDKISGKSKGYGFILFKSRLGARKALQNPQKKIGGRMTSCQLAAVGPVSTSSTSIGVVKPEVPVSEYTQRKIYVSNVSADIDPQKLTAYFGKFGEIEEGPLGLDKQTGKPKGFCLFVYKSVESAKKALEEPHKTFDGHVLHCQKAVDGPKHGKQQMGQGRGQHYGRRVDNPNFAGPIGGGPATGAGLMGQSVGGVGFNQGAVATAGAPGLNPALGQALTALLASQGAGLGLNNLLGTLGGGINPGPGGAGHGAYGGQNVGMNPTVLGGYGTQGGLQSAYPTQQMGQGGTGRSQHGHLGGAAPYGGH